ncbi:hypothetical protein QEZ54_11745 [Catellatospora sp. KI3]|uniref:hypothetical protein n=1 Tax=Catellatospora sp. KI3 TaxID=3041620 RepID=UPI00248268A0|nr:hypothetical protein [Catellatospora sp. KI3]MDI1461647.1 hypothetical protein [Catellatospora sp. KI3]
MYSEVSMNLRALLAALAMAVAVVAVPTAAVAAPPVAEDCSYMPGPDFCEYY